MMQQDTSDVQNRANQDVIENENKVEYATVIYYYMAKEDDELSLKVGDVIEVVSKDKAESGDDGWWFGRKPGETECKVFPANYVILETQNKSLTGHQ